MNISEVIFDDQMSENQGVCSPEVRVTDTQVYYRFSDGSTIKFTPGEFEERTCKEEFFADCSYMRHMFDVANNLIEDGYMPAVLGKETKESIILLAFNKAYFLLSRAFECREYDSCITVMKKQISYVRLEFFERFVYSIAYVICILTKDFQNVDRPIVFRNRSSLSMYYRFMEFGISKKITDPICFGKIRFKAQKAEEDPFDASIKQVVEAYNKLKTLNKENSEQLESEKKKSAKLEAKVAELKEKINNYDMQVQQQELKIQILEKYKEKKAPSADGVSLDAMSKYALGLAKDNEVQVLIDFMNHLIMENVYPVDVLRPLIKKLNEHKHKIQNPVLQQVNNFHSGSSFNDIHNNDNSNIHTNGRR